jgi:MFS family permease
MTVPLAEAPNPAEVPSLHPLRVANFCYYFFARFALTLAVTALVLIIGWQVYNIARETMSVKESAFLLGLIGLVQFVPLFLLTPVTGWIADRYDRRAISRIVLSIQAMIGICLCGLTWSGEISLPILFVAASMIGMCRAFSGPAMSALSPNLVPKDVLPTAIAMSSIAWQTGAIAGPGLGGLLLAISPIAAYALCTALFLIGLTGFLLIGKVPQPTMARNIHPIRQMVNGLVYVRQNRLVLATITLDLFAVLLAGATALMPVFARDILHVGPTGLGMMAGAPGVGAVVMAGVFSWRPLKRDVGNRMLLAVIIFGTATIVFGLSRWFPLSVAALVVIGAADMVSVYVRQSLIQLHTPDDMRGRVSSVSQMTISASNELGEAESGFLAALIGPVGAVIVGGAGAIAITLAWARFFPELRQAKTFDPPAPDPQIPTSHSPIAQEQTK